MAITAGRIALRETAGLGVSVRMVGNTSINTINGWANGLYEQQPWLD
jgi:hypothetical protein